MGRYFYSILIGICLSGCIEKGDTPEKEKEKEKLSQNNEKPELVVSGLAAKGILKYANVVVEEYVDSSWVKKSDTTTNANGAYSVTLTNYTDGPIRLTAKATDITKMTCDATDGCKDKTGAHINFGGEVNLPSDFTLRSIVPPKYTTAHITPLTDIAATNIIYGSTPIDSTKIKQSLAKVAATFGVTDILSIRPIDVTKQNSNSSAAEKKMALTIAAIADTLNSYKVNNGKAKTAADFTAAMQAMRKDFEDGSFDLKEKPKMSGKKSILETFLDKKQAHLDNPNSKVLKKLNYEPKLIAIDKNILTAKKNEVEQAKEKTDSLIPPEVETAVLDDIGKAKAIVNDIRTLFNSLGQIENPAEAFSKNISTAQEVVDQNLQDHIDLLDIIIGNLDERLPTKSVNNLPYPVFLPGCNVPEGLVCTTVERQVDAFITVTESVTKGLVIKLRADANATNKTPAFNITFSSPQARLADLKDKSPNRKLKKISTELADLKDKSPNRKLKKISTKLADLKDKSLNRKLKKISLNISGWFKGNKRKTEFKNLNLIYELDKPYNPRINDFDDGNVKRLVIKGDKLNFTQAAIGNKPKIGFEGAVELVTVSVDPEFADDDDYGAERFKKLYLKGIFSHDKESFKMIVAADLINAEKVNADKKSYAKWDLRLFMDAHFSGYPSTTATLAFAGTEPVGSKAILTIAQKEKGRSLTFSNKGKYKEIIKQFTVEASDGTKMIIKRDSKGQNSGIITVNDKQVATITDERFIKIKYKDGTFDSL